jgi:transposase-like protein
MPKPRPTYPPEFRRQIIELVNRTNADQICGMDYGATLLGTTTSSSKLRPIVKWS